MKCECWGRLYIDNICEIDVFLFKFCDVVFDSLTKNDFADVIVRVAWGGYRKTEQKT